MPKRYQRSTIAAKCCVKIPLPVMNPTSWYAANLTNTMVDANKTLQTFFDGCAAAGPNACAFYAPE
ncbi:hypothetical protein C8J57DRAFT_1503848 [Mycena rebaudengoi]|nr:hypothetical protein C8J57DRAFT_1503848 [Mycena rebaudengoi]